MVVRTASLGSFCFFAAIRKKWDSRKILDTFASPVALAPGGKMNDGFSCLPHQGGRTKRGTVGIAYP